MGWNLMICLDNPGTGWNFSRLNFDDFVMRGHVGRGEKAERRTIILCKCA